MDEEGLRALMLDEFVDEFDAVHFVGPAAVRVAPTLGDPVVEVFVKGVCSAHDLKCPWQVYVCHSSPIPNA